MLFEPIGVLMPKRTPADGEMNKSGRYFSNRLLDALQPMLKNPLTVVEAPAGYGKTVAVTEFLAGKNVTVVLTCAKERSPESFWPDFCCGLAKAFPEAEKVCARLGRLGFPHDFAQIRAALGLIDRVSFTRQTFLVFDDCHLLPRGFIGFCESLAAKNLPNLHVVCITRNAWASNWEEPHPQTSQSRLGRGVFTLTSLEIREYYARYGISLSFEQERELYEKTGGWISALSLSLLWYTKHGEFSFFPADLTALIKETVYASLSPEARELLFLLAPLERFTGFQASRLYGSDATALLDELTGKNAFVFFHPQSQFYSPHAIFRHFLLSLFNDDQVVPPERRKAILRACGDSLKDLGELASAMDAWYQAGDFERALAALEGDMLRNMVTERAGLYCSMFKDCPGDILEKYPRASFKYAIAALSVGDFSAFAERLQWLSKQYAAPSASSENEHWRGELHVLLALKEFNDIKAMSEHHTKAFALLKGPTSLYGADSSWTLGSPSVLFMFYRQSGALQDTLRLMRECMPLYYQLASYHGAGAELLMEAEALYNAGEFAGAKKTCLAGLETAVRHNQLCNVFCALFLRMRLALLEGSEENLFGRGEKPGLVADIRSLVARGRDFFLLHTADLCEGWVYAALGLYDKIPLWLRYELNEDSRLYAFARGFYYIVHGRARLLAGDYAKLAGLLEATLNEGTFSKNLLFSVYAHIYRAAALWKTGKSKKAVKCLKTALEIALPDALYMPFAELYDLIERFLNKAMPDAAHAGALPRIEALARQLKTGSKSIVHDMQTRQSLPLAPHAGEGDPMKFFSFAAAHDLTEKEMEVLSNTFRKLSIKEIATVMGISEQGVKFHIGNILQKTRSERRRDLFPLYAAWRRPGT